MEGWKRFVGCNLVSRWNYCGPRVWDESRACWPPCLLCYAAAFRPSLNFKGVSAVSLESSWSSSGFPWPSPPAPPAPNTLLVAINQPPIACSSYFLERGPTVVFFRWHRARGPSLRHRAKRASRPVADPSARASDPRPAPPAREAGAHRRWRTDAGSGHRVCAGVGPPDISAVARSRAQRRGPASRDPLALAVPWPSRPSTRADHAWTTSPAHSPTGIRSSLLTLNPSAPSDWVPSTPFTLKG